MSHQSLAVPDRPWIDQYPAGVGPEVALGKPDTIPALLERAAARCGSNIAVRFDGGRWTYEELRSLVARAAAGLQALGVRPGDHVAAFIPNHAATPIWFLATVSVGATLVSINALYTAPTVEHMISDSGARIVLTLDEAEIRSKVEPLIERGLLDVIVVASAGMADFDETTTGGNMDGPIRSFAGLIDNNGAFLAPEIDPEQALAVLQYTGGTTGVPKGAMLSHANLTTNSRQMAGWLPHLIYGQERFFLPLPLSHITGISVGMVLPLTLAAEMIVVTRFLPQEAISILRESRPTFFGGVPTIFIALLQTQGMNADDWTSVGTIICGGAPLPPEVMVSFETLSGVKVRQIYGSTEVAPAATLMPATTDEPVHSVGLPLPSTVVEIRDAENPERRVATGELGEIVIAGPQVMRGYWKREMESGDHFVDGFFRTGDIGRMDERGFVFVVDRLKDMIIASGYNIYPVNVENAIYEHPDVAEAAVIGVPDAYRGETVKAYVAPKPGRRIEVDALQAFLKDRLSPVEMPRQFEVRAQLPRTPVGKLSRLDLKRELQAG